VEKKISGSSTWSKGEHASGFETFQKMKGVNRKVKKKDRRGGKYDLIGLLWEPRGKGRQEHATLVLV